MLYPQQSSANPSAATPAAASPAICESENCFLVGPHELDEWCPQPREKPLVFDALGSDEPIWVAWTKWVFLSEFLVEPLR